MMVTSMRWMFVGQPRPDDGDYHALDVHREASVG